MNSHLTRQESHNDIIYFMPTRTAKIKKSILNVGEEVELSELTHY